MHINDLINYLINSDIDKHTVTHFYNFIVLQFNFQFLTFKTNNSKI